MKWIIYEIPNWRRVGTYPNRAAALNMAHYLHRDISERRYTVKQEVA
jgi:hypothetical protein